jgi:hypothetical protein
MPLGLWSQCVPLEQKRDFRHAGTASTGVFGVDAAFMLLVAADY